MKIAEGREAELFALPDGRVLRLVRADLPDAAEAVRMEAAALAAASRAGAPVPAVYETVTRGGRPGVVMERVDGTDLLALVGRRPWLVTRVARRTGEIHAELHRVRGPDDLPRTRALVASRLEGGGRAIPDALRAEALAALERLPDGDRLCHGDFHPGNVLTGPAGDRVIDWHNACVGDPMADVGRTWVVLEFSPLPPGSSRVERLQARAGRGLLLRGYLRAYARTGELDQERFQAWARILAVERLRQEIPGEREPILARLAHDRA